METEALLMCAPQLLFAGKYKSIACFFFFFPLVCPWPYPSFFSTFLSPVENSLIYPTMQLQLFFSVQLYSFNYCFIQLYRFNSFSSNYIASTTFSSNYIDSTIFFIQPYRWYYFLQSIYQIGVCLFGCECVVIKLPNHHGTHFTFGIIGKPSTRAICTFKIVVQQFLDQQITSC